MKSERLRDRVQIEYEDAISANAIAVEERQKGCTDGRHDRAPNVPLTQTK